MSYPDRVKHSLQNLRNHTTVHRTRQATASDLNMASKPLGGNLEPTNKDVAGLDGSPENTSSQLNDDVHALPPAQNRRILMKTDLVVLPCAVIAMTLAFLDKVSKEKTPPGFLNVSWLRQRAWGLIMHYILTSLRVLSECYGFRRHFWTTARHQPPGAGILLARKHLLFWISGHGVPQPLDHD